MFFWLGAVSCETTKSFPDMPYAYCWVNTTNSVTTNPWLGVGLSHDLGPPEGWRSEKRQQDLLLLWSSSSCGHGTMSFTTTVISRGHDISRDNLKLAMMI